MSEKSVNILNNILNNVSNMDIEEKKEISKKLNLYVENLFKEENMKNYLVLFVRDDKTKGYSVFFEGCEGSTCGTDFEDSVRMAKDYLELQDNKKEYEGERININKLYYDRTGEVLKVNNLNEDINIMLLNL